MKESELLKKFLIEYTKLGHRLFRINSGMGWTGKKIGPLSEDAVITLKQGDIVLRNPRPFHGTKRGTSDLLGWTTITVTEEMIGRKLAIFTAIEAKTGKLKATDEQRSFVRTVNSHGGIGIVAKKLEDILVFTTKFMDRGENVTKH